MVNQVHLVIAKESTVCFIISTETDNDFWYWEISKDIWDRYLENNPSDDVLLSASEFVNSGEYSHCGCSVASFNTIEEAVLDYENM